MLELAQFPLVVAVVSIKVTAAWETLFMVPHLHMKSTFLSYDGGMG